jgi:hypothetical protein
MGEAFLRAFVAIPELRLIPGDLIVVSPAEGDEPAMAAVWRRVPLETVQLAQAEGRLKPVASADSGPGSSLSPSSAARPSRPPRLRVLRGSA